MESYFNQEFKEYYQTCDDFAKGLINYCSVSNPDCSKEVFDLVIQSVDQFHIEQLKCDFEDRNTEQLLIPFDEISKLYLKRLFDELDGTLLLDIVLKQIKTHKIFN